MTTTETMAAPFEPTGETELDSRKRISLAKIAKHRRYEVAVNRLGEILLTPVVSINVRELDAMRDPETVRRLLAGNAQAAAGDLHDLGSFAQYADDE